MKFINIFCLLAFFSAIFLFTSSNNVLAVAPLILSYPKNKINIEIPFDVIATMSGLSKQSVYRLRLVLSVPGTSSYFGSTFNDQDWYNGLPSPINYSNFLTISTDENGAWFGKVQGKIDSSDKNFSGESGSYSLKIGRYTQNGSSATWSDPVLIYIDAPSLTPTTPPVAKTPTTTKIPAISNSLDNNQSKNNSGQQEKTTSANLYLSNEEATVSSSFKILGASVSSEASLSAIPTGNNLVENSSGSKIPLVFLLGGIMLFVGGGTFFFFRIKDRNKRNT